MNQITQDTKKGWEQLLRAVCWVLLKGVGGFAIFGLFWINDLPMVYFSNVKFALTPHMMVRVKRSHFLRKGVY